MNKVFRHVNCRNGTYAKTVQRFSVPDDFVPWSINFESYKPPHFESSVLKGKPWADPEIDEFKPKFNDLDGEVNRVSWVGKYEIIGGKPMNPFGRTGRKRELKQIRQLIDIKLYSGISGRGVLGRFGPNHAADPIVSTWKRDENKQIKKHPETKKPILRILCIERGDTGEIALPGGMVDPGEEVSVTLKREFIEEALNGKINESELDGFFSNGAELYKGYCDDPRNTDSGKFRQVFNSI